MRIEEKDRSNGREGGRIRREGGMEEEGGREGGTRRRKGGEGQKEGDRGGSTEENEEDKGGWD